MCMEAKYPDQNCIECNYYSEKCKGQNMCEWTKENCKKEQEKKIDN